MNSIDWKEISKLKKIVRASDQRLCGNIIAEYNDKIVVIQGNNINFGEYLIPKSKVDHYDGNEIYLNIPYDKISDFDF
jgi:hypothetical protein